LHPPSQGRRILLVGEVFVDRHVDLSLVRLGGILHAARGLNASGTSYSVAFVGPEYLDDACQRYFSDLGADSVTKIGNVIGAPNIVEIYDSPEAGHQRYVDLIGSERKTTLIQKAFENALLRTAATDILFFPSPSTESLIETAALADRRIHLDVDHIALTSRPLQQAGTIFGSTSGKSFAAAGRNPVQFLKSFSEDVILKENRGGSRALLEGVACEAPSYPTDTLHSVGVGDCFNSIWVGGPPAVLGQDRLKWCAYVASLYASTFDHKEFCENVAAAKARMDHVVSLDGVRLPWENRKQLSIYFAAPDFPSVDTRLLDELEQALTYHNFRVVRPIRENGLATSQMTPRSQRTIYQKDIELLIDATLLVAIPLTADPGTFAEVGWFQAKGKPAILFDPSGTSQNMFVRNSVSRVCRTRSQVIDATFELLGR
jgi:nucleoside 2-deoxyribosyltransferase